MRLHSNGGIQIHIAVVTRGDPIPNWMMQTFGGAVYLAREVYHTWSLPTSRQAEFLQGILPYVQLKRPQVELLLAGIETRVASGGRISQPTRLVRVRLCSLLTKEKDLWRQEKYADIAEGT